MARFENTPLSFDDLEKLDVEETKKMELSIPDIVRARSSVQSYCSARGFGRLFRTETTKTAKSGKKILIITRLK